MESFLNGRSSGHHSGTLVLVAVSMMKIELLLTISVTDEDCQIRMAKH